jgi:hypothetical protein
MVSAISVVSDSCICRRRAYMSTMRATFDRPSTLPVGNVGDVALADEGQQVMLAQGVELDVLHQHHLVAVGGEEGVIDDVVDGLLIAAGEELEGPAARSGVSAGPGAVRSSPTASMMAAQCASMAHLARQSGEGGADGSQPPLRATMRQSSVPNNAGDDARHARCCSRPAARLETRNSTVTGTARTTPGTKRCSCCWRPAAAADSR